MVWQRTIKGWALRFLRFLGFAEGRERDVLVEQAVVRLVITGAVLAYAVYAFSTDTDSLGLRAALAIAVAGFTGGIVIYWWLRTHTARSVVMKLIGIAADMVLLTVGIGLGGEHAVPLIGVYLWVTVGNGFRFGPRYLLVSYWASLFSFGMLLVFVPFWLEHRAIGIGFFLVLALIPLYVLVLLSRLQAQKDAAEQLSNAKSRFVANVSHELRTPLAGVFAVYDLLRLDAAPRHQELVKSLGGAIASLKHSVDDILQMSKLEAGAEKMEARVFNLRVFLQRLSGLVQPQATAKGLEWRLDMDDNVQALALGDVSHIEHVLGNLVNNAIKFTAAGSVRLKVLPGNAGRVRFEVIDTGIGIAPEQQARLFERFVQADDSAKRRFGGTGLGTSIAHDLVELMGGEIGVSSASGAGSTFWVELPLPEPGVLSAKAERHGLAEVWLVGIDGPETWMVQSQIRSLGAQCRVLSPGQPIPAAGNQPLAAFLLVSPQDVLASCSRLAMPWFVIAPVYSAQERVALYRAGAAGLLPAQTTPELLDLYLCSLMGLPPVAAPTKEAAAAERALRIVLADDHHSNSLLLKHILESAGHVVTIAARGDEAFDLMVQERPDLAILDLNMPDMTGTEVIKLYRAGEAGGAAQLPIMILSADATPAAKEESMAAGADEYLTKPVTATDLLDAVARHAKRHAPPAPAEAAKPAATTNPAAAVPIRGVGGPPGLVDAERLAALREIAGGEREFLSLYLSAAFSDIEQAISDLDRAVVAAEQRAARDALHKIDGTAASIGAVALMEESRNIRSHYLSAAAGDAASAAAVAKVASVCALTKSALSAMIGETQVRPAP